MSLRSPTENENGGVSLHLAWTPFPLMGKGRDRGARELINVTPTFVLPRQRLCRNPRNLIDVMLSKAKHLAFSGGYEVEILRLRLRMTLRHSLSRGRNEGAVPLGIFICRRQQS
jgi:hypothetical protein